MMGFVLRRVTIPVLLMVLLLMISIQTPAEASKIIFDDFNDMNYDGWGTFGTIFTREENKYYPAGDGNFSAADGTLRVTGPAGNWTHQPFSIGYINHSVTHGTWSFDLFVVDTPSHEILVHLMADEYYPAAHSSLIPGQNLNISFCILIATDAILGDIDRPMVVLLRINDGRLSIVDRHYIEPRPWTNCWNHFDVTRDSTGYFNIFLNETLIISTHQPHDFPGGYFVFAGQTGQAIDNILINDIAILPPPEPTEITTIQTTDVDLTSVMIGISTVELVVIVVLVLLYFKERKT